MPQFKQGKQSTAKITLPISPSGISCSAELYLTNDGVTKNATSGQIPFTSTGIDQTIQLPIKMPEQLGEYVVRVLIKHDSTQLGAYQAQDNVIIAEPSLILTGKNLYGPLWSGSITEISSGRRQVWGVSNAQLQPATLSPLLSKDILLEYTISYGVKNFGPYKVTTPILSGDIEWDGSALELNGVKGTDLRYTNNRQIIKGTLIIQQVFQDYGPRVTLIVTGSESIPSYENIGQYFIGQQIEIWCPFPMSGVNPTLQTGREVVCTCWMEEKRIGNLYIGSWVGNSISYPLEYPTSAYSFNASGSLIDGTVPYNMSWFDAYGFLHVYWVDKTVKKYLKLTISGTVSPFSIVILRLKWVDPVSGPVYGLIINSQGPVSNAQFDICPNWMGAVQSIIVYAHPNPNKEFNVNTISVDNWQKVLELPIPTGQ